MSKIVKGLSLVFVCAVLLVGSATASVEGLRVSTPDTCWYTGNMMALPILVEWTTWSQYPPSSFNDPSPLCFSHDCDGPEYWVAPEHDTLIRGYLPSVPGLSYCNYPDVLPDSLRPDLPDEEMCAFEIYGHFDEDVIQGINVSNSELLDENWEWDDVFYEFDNNSGEFYIAVAASDCQDLTDLDDPTVLVWLGFYVDGGQGDHTGFMIDSVFYNEVDPYFVFIDNREYYQDCDNDGMDELVYTGNKSIGDFIVCEDLYASGRVTYMSNGRPVCGADAMLKYIPDPDAQNPPNIPDKVFETRCEISCENDCRGSFFIPDITSEYHYCLGVWHDDEDAYDVAISAFDASLILRHLVGQFHLDDFHQIVAADVTGNCDISAMDASQILKWLVGEYDYFLKKRAEETNWLFVTANSPHDLCPVEEYCWDPMTRSASGSDFEAIILGDVSGNWGIEQPAPKFVAGDPVTAHFIGREDGRDIYELRSALPQTYGYQFETSSDVKVSGCESESWFSQIRDNETGVAVAAAGAEPTYVMGRFNVPQGTENVELRNIVLNEYRIGNQEIVLKGTDDVLPSEFSLGQAYPNPFNPTTNIDFALPAASDVSLVVYNMLGQEVKTLVNGHRDAGVHSVTWDGTNDAGEQAASGIYLYRLVSGDKVDTKKMVLMK